MREKKDQGLSCSINLAQYFHFLTKNDMSATAKESSGIALPQVNLNFSLNASEAVECDIIEAAGAMHVRAKSVAEKNKARGARAALLYKKWKRDYGKNFGYKI